MENRDYSLTIKSGGKLFFTRWVYDEVANEGRYVEKDVTEQAPHYLFYTCWLDDDILLRDVFLLLKQHLDIFRIVISEWVSEIVAEGLHQPVAQGADISYLELYWMFDYYESEKQLMGNLFPEFHGVGDVDQIPYSVALTPTNELADLPLRLCRTLRIWNEDKQELREYEGPEFSLGHILRGILWEMTWHGFPERRDAFKNSLLSNKRS
ncbi:MAG: hypothetical protein U0175_18110 [Caldilineaceae bacterium]